MKLDIGSGASPKEGYISVDIYAYAMIKADMSKLPFHDESIEEIYSSHTLEHCSFKEVGNVLNEWYRVLQKGGKLILIVPDFENCITRWRETGNQMYIFGNQDHEYEYHKCLFTEESIKKFAIDHGFAIESISTENSHDQVGIRLQCLK